MDTDVDFISEVAAMIWLERAAKESGLDPEEVMDVYYDIRPYDPTRAEITRAVKESLEEFDVFID